MNKKLLTLVLAGVLAMGGVLAVVSYARDADARAYDGAKLTSVLVVSQPVPAGSPASRLAGSVETIRVPQSVVVEGVVTDLSSLGGEVTNTALVPGEQLLEARFGDQVKAVKKSALPSGTQKIDLVLTAPRVPADVEAGDVVGVLASYAKSDGNPGKTSMALNKIVVLAVKDDVAGGTGDQAGAVGRRVTLAVTAGQAEKIANVAEFGKIWLTAQGERAATPSATEAKDAS